MAAARTILALLLCASTVAVVVFCLFVRREPCVLKGFDQIEVGMTEEEVIALVGIQPGDFRTSQWINICDFMAAERKEAAKSGWPGQREWIADHAAFAVYFDERGKVERKWYQPVPLRTYEKLEHRRWMR